MRQRHRDRRRDRGRERERERERSFIDNQEVTESFHNGGSSSRPAQGLGITILTVLLDSLASIWPRLSPDSDKRLTHAQDTSLDITWNILDITWNTSSDLSGAKR